jgi:UDP-glucose 4-epimerase
MEWVGKHVLVTGGAGFIGSHLSAKLLSLGAHVTVIDDLSAGDMDRVPKGVNIIEGCITDSESLSNAMQGSDAVFHLAAIASVPLCEADPAWSDKVNFQASLEILSTANCPVIFASSAAIYGEPVEIPITEKHPISPVGYYGQQKATIDANICSLDSQSTPACALRFFNVYGAGQDPSSQYSGVLSIFIDRASTGRQITIFGDGEQTRDFIHVSDVVQALIMTGSSLVDEGVSSPAHASAFNICTGSPVTLNEVVGVISSQVEGDVVIAYEGGREGDIKHSSGDSTKLQSTFDWRPETSLVDGLSLLISQVN